MGPKAFEQAAGFLRIREGSHPLDASAVHPESYGVVEAIAKDLGHPLDQVVGDASISGQIDPQQYLSDTVGLPTLLDIIAELTRPGRDPRQEFEPFHFAEGVNKIEDLSAGMKLPGVVTNVTDFGAFVDVGVHQGRTGAHQPIGGPLCEKSFGRCQSSAAGVGYCAGGGSGA